MNDPRPAFLFHVRDFWTAECVETMTAAQIGVYLFLLSRQWETGSLPSDAAAVLRLCSSIAGVAHADVEVVLMQFPVSEDGRRRNPRMEFERALADERSVKASNKAKGRWDLWRARKQGSSDAVAVLQQCSSSATAMQGREGKGSEGIYASGEPKPPAPAPTKPRVRPNQGAHVRAMEMFQRAWARFRCKSVLDEHGITMSRDVAIESIPVAARYMPTVADWTAAARLWKQIGGDVDLLNERMANFFGSDAPYMRAGGFALFASKFSVLVEPIRALNGTQVQE